MTMKRYKLVHAQKDLLEYRIIFINTYKILVKIEGDWLSRFSETVFKVIQGTKCTLL